MSVVPAALLRRQIAPQRPGKRDFNNTSVSSDRACRDGRALHPSCEPPFLNQLPVEATESITRNFSLPKPNFGLFSAPFRQPRQSHDQCLRTPKRSPPPDSHRDPSRFGAENREQIHRWVGPQGRIGAPEFRIADGTRYRRIWFDGEPGPASPVRYTEEVFDEPDSFSRPRRIAQEAMLYGREVAPGRSEYLLPALETTDGESSVTVMVGIDLDRSAVRVL